MASSDCVSAPPAGVVAGGVAPFSSPLAGAAAVVGVVAPFSSPLAASAPGGVTPFSSPLAAAVPWAPSAWLGRRVP